uniref:Uncharacterized protein n=1 Tax=Octopus bimaculoides TaxID=37653 RepID=A0A0L8GBQ7_OCTBM
MTQTYSYDMDWLTSQYHDLHRTTCLVIVKIFIQYVLLPLHVILLNMCPVNNKNTLHCLPCLVMRCLVMFELQCML